MDLDEFVRDTLVCIASGVRLAQEELKGTKAYVNPTHSNLRGGRSTKFHEVAFDVAVTVGESAKGKAEGGIKVMSVGIGGGASSESSSEIASRISFTLRMILPTTDPSDWGKDA